MSLLSPSMEDLPENVMVDILSRVHVKTIIHCKCVCKKWLDLLSDSYFANLHLSRSPAGLMIHHNSKNKMTFFYPKPGILKWVEVEDELDHHNLHHDPVMSLDLNPAPIFRNSEIRPVGSVNGLICFTQFVPKEDFTYISNEITRSDDIYICNPITREYMILPRPRYNTKGQEIILYGFGVSSLTGEYKVIRILYGVKHPDSTSTSEAEVYTVGMGQWRSLGHVPFWPNNIYGIFLNGHAHWTVFDRKFCGKIFSFDFDRETFEWFPGPPVETIEESKTHSQSLGLVKGCLCRCDSDVSEFRIWVMKEYGIKESWHKEVVVKNSIFRDLNWLMRADVYLLEGLKDGTIVVVSRNKLLAYCPQRNIIVDMKLFDIWFSGLRYRPSFLKLQNLESESESEIVYVLNDLSSKLSQVNKVIEEPPPPCRLPQVRTHSSHNKSTLKFCFQKIISSLKCCYSSSM